MPSPADKIRKFADLLESLPKRLSIAPAAPAIAQIVEDAATQQIQSQGSRGGSRFTPLAKSTLEQRRRQGISSNAPLVAKGRLIRYLAQGATATVSASDKKINISFSKKDPELAKIAAIQQKGSKDIPAREIFELTEQDRSKIKQAAGETLFKQVKDIIKSGLK